MRLSRSCATFITLLLSTGALIPPASAVVANDEYGAATVLISMPVVLNADATNATTSVANGRPGCYRDMWYRLPSITSLTVVSRVSGGTAYVLPSADAASWWDTNTARAAIPADGNVSRWAAGSYLVVCRDTDSAGVVSVSLDGQLIAPTPVTSASGNHAFTVTWGAAANGESLVGGYRVDYRAVGSGTWSSSSTLSTGTRTYTVSGLVNGSQYEYRVWAVSAYGSSAALNTQAVWVGKPVDVAALTITASYHAVIVSWRASAETAVVSAMQLTVSCNGVVPQTYQSPGPTAGSKAFVGLAPGTACTATGKWLGLYGFDAAASPATPFVTTLEYPSPTSVRVLRESGTSIVRWVMPAVVLPTGTTLALHRVSVQCTNPSWTVAVVEVGYGATQWSTNGMALGATCVASVYSVYRDALGNLGQSVPTLSAATRVMEPPVQPVVGAWKPVGGNSMAFPLTVASSAGREPESVTVSEYRAGVPIAVTVLTAATGWTYTFPITEASMNATETFTAVAFNSVGGSSALTWVTQIPSLPETLTASRFTATFLPAPRGPRHIAVAVTNDGSRPWMRDPTATYRFTARNTATGVERVVTVPVSTISIPDLGVLIPSTTVRVALVTAMGTSPTLAIVGGAVGPKPIARVRVTGTTASSARLAWSSSGSGGQLRVEVYRGTSFLRLLSVGRAKGGLTITGLSANSPYTLAIYTYDGSAFSAKPLIVKVRTLKR